MLTDGVYGVSGPDLFINGSYAGSIPTPGTSYKENFGFYLGGVYLSGGSISQHIKANVKRILIVNRKLTSEEQAQIFNQIKGYSMNTVTYLTEPVTYEGEIVEYDSVTNKMTI